MPSVAMHRVGASVKSVAKAKCIILILYNKLARDFLVYINFFVVRFFFVFLFFRQAKFRNFVSK